MQKHTINTNREKRSQRLDKFLVEKLTELSRSQIQKAIKDGSILVNGKKATVHYFLKTNDEIKILSPKSQIPNKPQIQNLKNNKGLPATDCQLQITSEPKIIEDGDDFLIIEKPTGLLVHPTEKNENNTLVDWLLEKYPELKKIGEDPSRPAIVHRLDKDVSGLILIPKTQEAFDYFKKQFQRHLIVKKYLALAEGPIAKDEAEINFPISRSKNKPGLFAAQPASQKTNKEKKALTRLKVLKRFKNYTLLEVEILTGRTHQIRVHLLAYGHPIAGDALYNPQKGNKNKLARIFLHATELAFTGLDGVNHKFVSPLPETLADYLKNLK
jgi:23S rRNA pseudouridine1911/1915/1917 synthase